MDAGRIGPASPSSIDPAGAPVVGTDVGASPAEVDGTFGATLDQLTDPNPQAKAIHAAADVSTPVASSDAVGSASVSAAVAPAATESAGPSGTLDGLAWAPGSGPGTGTYTGVWPSATGNMIGGWPTYQGQAPKSIFEPESGQVLATYPDGTVVDLASAQIQSAVSSLGPAGSDSSPTSVSSTETAAATPEGTTAAAQARSVTAPAGAVGPTGTLDGLKWAPGSGPGTGQYTGVWPGATGNMIGGWPTYQGQAPSRIFEPESGQVLASYPDGAVVDLAIGEVLDPGAGAG